MNSGAIEVEKGEMPGHMESVVLIIPHPLIYDLCCYLLKVLWTNEAAN